MSVKIEICEHDRNQIRNIIEGLLVYGLGDLLAQIILGTPSLIRTIGVALIGSSIYALEVPLWFRMIEGTFCLASDKIRACQMFQEPDRQNICHLDYKGRTLMAMSYFNPIWIARHMFFLSLLISLSNGTAFISPFRIFVNLIPVAAKSFLFCIPITVIGNYLVQNRIKMRYRLIGSAILSAICVFWFAISKVLFGG
jgi:hypothetical protein